MIEITNLFQERPGQDHINKTEGASLPLLFLALAKAMSPS
jgi:hypothetical protein